MSVTSFDPGIDTAAQPWVWTVRDISLTEFDGLVDGYLDVQAHCKEIALGAGDFVMTLPLAHPAVPILLTEGAGVVARLPGAATVIASGTVNQEATLYQDSKSGPDQVTFTGPMDEAVLAGEQAWPEPGKWLNDVTSRNVLSSGVDARTGIAEDVLLGYIADNIGPSAFHSTSTTPHIDRRMPELVIPTSAHRGTSGSYQANFNTLLAIAQAICATSGITISVRQAGSGQLALAVRARANKSADVIFSRVEGSLDSATYTRQAPTITRGIAFNDDGTNRSYAMVVDTAAEALWGQRWVSMTDGATNIIADLLTAAGALVATGTELAGAVLAPVVLPGAPVFGVDYMLGDTVTAVDSEGNSITDQLVQMDYQHTAGAAPTITPSIAISADDLTAAHVPVIRALTAAIRALQRRPR